jgi:hypothetical protein
VIIWFAVLIPLAGAGALYWIFHHKVAIWESAMIGLAPILFIAMAKGCSEYSQTKDTEYWGGYVTSAEYYEDWNEKVSCRHEISCSHPEYSTDSNGRRYQSGYQHSNDGYYHLYDVDYHPEYWQLHTSVGETLSASKPRFDQLAVQFGNRKFVELRRDYHTDDGDKYVAAFMGEAEKLEPVTVERSYENRVQASQSVFNFKEVNPKDYGLYEYPKIMGLTQPCVLGPGATAPVERKVQYLNATLGASKQVRLFILVFQDKPIQASMEQEAYWKRGNKNELVTCVGVDKDLAVQWAHVFSWTEVEELKIEARNEVMGQKTLDLVKYLDWLGPAVQEKWRRKNFDEFSYLTVEPSTAAVVWTFIGTLLITVGIGVWAILNDVNPNREQMAISGPSFISFRSMKSKRPV